jgi:hypothetical protein
MDENIPSATGQTSPEDDRKGLFHSWILRDKNVFQEEWGRWQFGQKKLVSSEVWTYLYMSGTGSSMD